MISANIIPGGFKVSGMEMSSENVQNVSQNKTEFSSYMDGSKDANENVDMQQMSVSKEDSESFISSESGKIGNLFSSRNQVIADENVAEESDSGINVLAVMDVAAAQLVQQVIEVIRENTGCTQEELQNAMNAIGAEPVDLLSADTVKNLVMELNGLNQLSEFLVSQETYQQYTDTVKEIENLISDFAEKIELTPEQAEDIADIIRQVPQQKIPAENTYVNENEVTEEQLIPDEGKEFYQAADVPDAAGVSEIAEVATDDADEVIRTDIGLQENVKITNEMEGTAKIPKEEETVTISQEMPEETPKGLQIQQETLDSDRNQQRGSADSMLNSGKDSKELHMTDKNNPHNTEFATITNNLFEHIRESIADVNGSERMTDSFATRILEQVMDGIRVMSGEEMTSMEMQLYPENLGRLNIQVVSKDGIVTAQIIAQNEAVKEVIESQLYLLKENMSDREVMIEDVEVTVSSHAFEQEMYNGNSNDSNQQQKQRRFVSDEDTQAVNAADIKSLKEEILEEAMKEQNGSTVSYTA